MIPIDDSSVTVVCDDALRRKEPLVSVCVVTYNQAEYVGDAIESVLKQETNFDFELIVGDDCSTDGTPEVLRRYQRQHPETIRLNLHQEHFDGIPARKNMVVNLKSARGRYVALLDGDDYWLSRDKLQRQANFLEAHPEVTLSFHDARVVYEDEAAHHEENSEDVLLSVRAPDALGEDAYLETDEVVNWERAGHDFEIPASSVMFRRELFSPLPDWLWDEWFADRRMQAHCAEHGRVYYHAGLRSCYRRNAKGVTVRFAGTTEALERKAEVLGPSRHDFVRPFGRHQQLNPLYRQKMRFHWQKGEWGAAALSYLRSTYHRVLYHAKRLLH